MKNFQQNLKWRAGIIGMIALVSALFASCTKNRYDNDAIVIPPAALVSVIDASPDAPSLDFYLDNNMVNLSPITYGRGLDYFKAYTGKRTATFYTAGTKTIIKSDTMSFKANTFYSLFLANVVAKADYLLTVDSIKEPAAGKALIRLVNVSPDAPAVDLGVKNGVLLASNKAYKAYSSFVSIPGSTAYTLEVRQAGTSTVLATIANVNLYSKSVYTIFLHGLAAGTGSTALTADIQTNAYYY
jgi:hypothetical protein